ncbi:MAG: hypothetical protein K2G14_03140 [Ruminococcus sp.]|nr:hypothetical protein [Ruminococcus sp.]
MNKNKKDFMNQLSDLDDLSVEEIAENYPALDEKTKKRIIRKSMKKYRFSADRNNYSEELTVSGTEHYNRVTWYKYASSVAALVVAVVGIASVVMIRGNLNGDNDFEIDTPPAVSSEEPEIDSMSEAATATTSKKGYVAGGYDYANDNEYSGIIVGEPSQTTPAVDESSSVNTAEEPSVNNNSSNTPATQAPVTPPVTQPPTTFPVTEDTQSESQKSYLDGLYYVDIKGLSGYMAFDFMPDGTLTKYAFDDYGNVINDTIVTTTYEIVENQFSFGDINSEFDKKTGIIVNPNDTGNFSVQFEDGLYTFSQETPVFATSGITLSGLWYGNSAYGLRKLEFYSDTSGIFFYTNDIINVEFEYKIENNHVYFIVYGDTLEGDITRDYDGQRFTVLWNDGTTEYFYDEKTWLEMNE